MWPRGCGESRRWPEQLRCAGQPEKGKPHGGGGPAEGGTGKAGQQIEELLVKAKLTRLKKRKTVQARAESEEILATRVREAGAFVTGRPLMGPV